MPKCVLCYLLLFVFSVVSASSELKVVARSACRIAPGPAEAKIAGGVEFGLAMAANNFAAGGAGNAGNEYILKHSRGVGNNPLSVPALGDPAGTNFFRGNDAGLHTMYLTNGLTCDNCTVTRAGETTSVVGTAANPALILSGQGIFTGTISLNGDCTFTLRGAGNYNLACRITGNGSPTYNIVDANGVGFNAGITLSGTASNDYTGSTTIRNGFIACNKQNGVAIPHNIIVAAAAPDKSVRIWCQNHNQFGTGAVIDFRGAAYFSYISLNGTSQTVAGIQANNIYAVAENNWDKDTFPPGMTSAEVSTHSATLNIAGGETPCTFGGGGYLRNGFNGTSNGQSFASPELIVNVTSGTQIIQNPSGNIYHVTLASEGEGVLEFNGNGIHSFGEGVTFKGSGIIKKTGTGTIATNNSAFLKSGTIQVLNGTLRNHGTGVYATANGINTAALRVEASTAGNNPIF